MLNVYVIGCGGIGGYIIDRLPMVISSLSLDLEQSTGRDIQKYLDEAGNIAFPCVVDNLVLVDGDVFTPRNAMRQGMGAGSKLAQRMLSVKKTIERGLRSRDAAAGALKCMQTIKEMLDKEPDAAELKASLDWLMDDTHLTQEDIDRLQSEMVRVSCLQNMRILGYNEYIRPSNFKEIMPENRGSATQSIAMRHLDGTDALSRRLLHNTVVFIGVDNAKTRYEVSKYMETFNNCLLINGGNSKTEGHVTVYERIDGKAMDPQLYELYPDISPDADQRPDEMACTTVAPSHDQIAVTNSMVADVMLSKFIRWARCGLSEPKVKDGANVRYNEVQLEIDRPSMLTLYHPLRQKKE